VSFDTLFGKWEYESPSKNIKLTYDFTLEKKFVSLAEHKEKEIKTAGDFKLDKKGGIDRLVLTTKSGTATPQPHTTYHFLKFSGPDTLKIQLANNRLSYWQPETTLNTLKFIRKKEKAKEKEKEKK
jgi:hypothetical protein